MKAKEKLAEGYIWPVSMLPASSNPEILKYIEKVFIKQGEEHEEKQTLLREVQQSLAQINRQDRYIAELEKHNPYNDTVVHDPKHPHWIVQRSRIKCPLYNAKSQTNADRIRAMSDEELADEGR